MEIQTPNPLKFSHFYLDRLYKLFLTQLLIFPGGKFSSQNLSSNALKIGRTFFVHNDRDRVCHPSELNVIITLLEQIQISVVEFKRHYQCTEL